MTRTATSGLLTALVAPVVRPVLLFHGEFASGALRLWSGVGSLVWGGKTWTGAGNLLNIGGIAETSEVVASGTTISLSGVPVALVSAAILDARQGLPGRIYLGLLDEAGSLIADPVLLFLGRLDVPEIADGEDDCTITISYESRLIDLQTPREWRWTHESQRALYPNDDGLKFVTTIQGKEIKWGG